MVDTMKKAAISMNKLIVTIVCVMGIAGIMYMHVCKSEDMGYVSVVAMVLIAALGGVDSWKNGMLDKLSIGKVT